MAFCGILGGLGAWALFEREPELRAWRGRATLAIPPSILDTALGDIHGVAYLAGLLPGTAWALRGSPHAPADPRPGSATAPPDRAVAQLSRTVAQARG